MRSRACLKCGHVAEYEGEPADACPMCGAHYARVEAALARGETVERAAPDAIVARLKRRDGRSTVPPSLLVSMLISVGFVLTLFALLAGVAVFGKVFSAQRGFDSFVLTLVVAWTAAAVVSLALSLLRRPVAGLLGGMGMGLLAGIIAGFILL